MNGFTCIKCGAHNIKIGHQCKTSNNTEELMRIVGVIVLVIIGVVAITIAS